jgi:prolipoprotein diacylglyceryl transferase
MPLSTYASLLATIPPPPFRNVEVGPLTLHGYGLTMGIAIITAIWICEWALQRQGVSTERFTALALLCIVGGFVGARLYHIASQPVFFAHHPSELPAVWHGGLGIYGAVFGGGLTGLLCARRFGIPVGALGDAITPAVLVAQAIGRVGNYLNQELFGKPFDGAWALRVERGFRPGRYTDIATYHPTFLYELIGNALLAVLVLVLVRRWNTRVSGVLFWLYVSAYSTLRIVVEPLRIDDAHHWHGVRQNVWVAGSLIILGLVMAYVVTRRGRHLVDGRLPDAHA